jgi:hypothetical protein
MNDIHQTYKKYSISFNPIGERIKTNNDDDDDNSQQLGSFKSNQRQITVDQSLYFAGTFGWLAESPPGELSSSQASIQVTIASASLLK